MARVRDTVYTPNPAAEATYDVLYREYVRLHDYFGRGGNDVMRTLRGLRVAARRAAGGGWRCSRGFGTTSSGCTLSCLATSWSCGPAATSAPATRRPVSWRSSRRASGTRTSLGTPWSSLLWPGRPPG